MAITVQRGITTFSGSNDTATLSTPVDRARSFVVVTSTTNGIVASVGAEAWAATAVLTADDTLTFKKGSALYSCTVKWEVVTCDQEEFLTKRYTCMVGTTATVGTAAIDEVDISRTMLIYSVRGNYGTTDTISVFATAVFNSSIELGLERGIASSERAYLEVEVVEWSLESGVKVATDLDMVSGDLSSPTNVAHGATVTVDNTWLFARCFHATNGLEQCAMRMTFDATNIIYDRYDVTTSYYTKIAWQLITFPEDICYQETFNTAATTDSTVDKTITAVTLANSMVFGNNNCDGTGNAFARNAWSLAFTSTTNVRANRSYTGQQCEFAISIVDFTDWEHSAPNHFMGLL